MKKIILNFLKKEISKKYTDYSQDKIDEIMYGIEGIYLTITKTVIIFFVAFILGVAKELFFILIAFNIIRIFAFGMHADSSLTCLIFSSVVFLGSSIISKYIIINKIFVILIYSIIFLLILKYAPADTVKRPLINQKKRIVWKIMSFITILIYFIITMIFKNNTLTNYLISGSIIECILIIPFTYKAFKMPYMNYKNYGLNT